MLAGQGAVILKRDLKDAFRIIAVAVPDQRLLDFIWEKIIYTECCLPFGLATAPFLFNLFAEALHWILERRLHPILIFFALVHYLDDFIFILRSGSNLGSVVTIYNAVITRLGFPPNTVKDSCGSIAEVLGYQVSSRLSLSGLKPLLNSANNSLAAPHGLLKLFIWEDLALDLCGTW